jgi:hypothetical protein
MNLFVISGYKMMAISVEGNEKKQNFKYENANE